ncbi:zinc finger protein [Rhizoctonia solani]|uniref:Zinc finger protein n=1 Tax=Rhizoctonia solani TaxID=456999 RepID=A0A8H7IBM7_9AGAM|nr:zinc finger protein [Rhizoctonia solani]
MPAAVPILNPRMHGGDAFSFRGNSGRGWALGTCPLRGTPGNWSGTPMSLGFGMGTSFKPESLNNLGTGTSWKADSAMPGVAPGTSFVPGSFSGMGSSWKVGQNGHMYFLSDVPGGPLMGPMDIICRHPSSLSMAGSFDLWRGRAQCLGGDEFCRNYTCCGIPLPDLHSLVEHFEEAHVVVIDPANPPLRQANNNNHNHDHGVFPISPNTQPTTAAPGGFDPDSMELDSSPATADSSSRSTTPPRAVFPTAILQGHGSKSSNANGQTKPTTLMPFRPTSMQSVQPNPNEAFNRYAGYSDFSSRMPGTVPPVPTASATDTNNASDDHVISPGMLFERGRKSSRDGTPGTSRLTSPGPVAGITVSGNPHGTGSPDGTEGRGWDSTMSSQAPSPTASELAEYFGQSGEQNGNGDGLQASTTLSRPSTSLMLSKPYKCPTRGATNHTSRPTD